MTSDVKDKDVEGEEEDVDVVRRDVPNPTVRMTSAEDMQVDREHPDGIMGKFVLICLFYNAMRGRKMF